MYFYGALNQMRLFYDYSNEEWIDLDDSNEKETQGDR